MLKAETDTGTVYYTRGFELISRREATTASYYVYDGGLSVRALTNEAGIVTDTLVFDAFGNETTKTGSSDNPYGFQGEEKDDTGLYYLRARYMDPATGTFTTMDTYGGSLTDPMSLHKYLFANSNPVMYSDPSGHSTSLNEVNSVVGIMTILASASTVVIYNIIGDIYGADKTQPSYWIGMVVAVILVAVLTYFTAGAFVEGIAICALGKILIGIMGLITANICCNLSNEARVKGYELYGDIFEFASVLLQTYAFSELLEGIAEGWNSLKEKISNAWQPNKHGAVYVGNGSDDYSPKGYSDGNKYYYIEGRPDGGYSSGDQLVRKDKCPIKSESFVDFLLEQGEDPIGWRKICETWVDSDGIYYERHYWTNGTKSYYYI